MTPQERKARVENLRVEFAAGETGFFRSEVGAALDEIDRLREALNKICSSEHLMNTNVLTSFPPKNAAVRDIQNIARETLGKSDE